jgi:hypothetical protein
MWAANRVPDRHGGPASAVDGIEKIVDDALHGRMT